MRDPVTEHLMAALDHVVGAMGMLSQGGSPLSINMAPARERLRQARAAYEEATPPPEPTKAELRQQAKDTEAEMADRLAIDLFCGLGGWAEGLLAEGYDVVGFDIERHQYGAHRYPAHLVIQDVLTLHGSQFRDAALIVASPPCQEYSYMAMPWSRAKAKAAAIRADESGHALADLNRLFDACFRIQAQASLAAGRKIPMVVENVRGAQPWVGRARWNFGSFYLWGDVPALMPFTKAVKNAGGGSWDRTRPSSWHENRASSEDGGDWFNGGQAVPGFRFDGKGGYWQSDQGTKHRGSGAVWFDTGPAALPSSSPRRKQASAMIAMIPLPLSRHIAATYRG